MIKDESITTLTQCFVDRLRYSTRTNAGMKKKVFVEYAACLHYKSNKLYGIKHSFCSHIFFVSPTPPNNLRILTAKFKGKKKNILNREKHVNIEETIRNSKKIFFQLLILPPALAMLYRRRGTVLLMTVVWC